MICLHALIELKNAAAARQVDLPGRFNDVLEKGAEYLAAALSAGFHVAFDQRLGFF